MTLPWKVRALLRAQAALTSLRLLPGSERVLSWPVAKRMAMAPGKAFVGRVPDVATEDLQVATRDGEAVRVRVYRPERARGQPLLYAHGGGFALGGIASCDHICRRLADETGAVVVSVEYRLAPEHRFPGPLHDVLDVLDWLPALGLDLASLVLAGDSAGGNLAAATAVVLRDQGRPLAGQLLIYPAVDLAVSEGAAAYRGPGLSGDDCRLCAHAYLGDHDRTDPYASPWYADPTGLAPAFVLTVAYDPLRDEGAAYAEKLAAAGVPVEHLDLVDHVHGSLSLPRLYRGVDEAYDAMARFVRRVAAPAG